MANVHPRWRLLLEWLSGQGMNTDEILVEARTSPGAGYGLFALKDIPPSTPLFTIPAKAMMNIRTLVGLYPKTRPNLTAFQIMSMHLFLFRPPAPKVDSKDTAFGPYISILPSDFETHPLSWLIKSRGSGEKCELLEYLPKDALDSLRSVSMRFSKDWERVSHYLRDNPALLAIVKAQGRELLDLDSVAAELDFLWGWLNVNTRSIYHRLCEKRSDPDNMTMCPILDFANHSNQPEHTYPQLSHAEVWDQAPSKSMGDDFVLLSPKERTSSAREEVFLRYGPHPNRTLFVEYGFVRGTGSNTLENNSLDCEADLLRHISALFAKRGIVGKWMEELLRTEGYWGDWTIHSAPEPAHPSFRLVTALRLYHSVSLEAITPPEDETEVRAWQGTITGSQDMVSIKNEIAWRETLGVLCSAIENESSTYLNKVEDVGETWPKDSSVVCMRWGLSMLWREQQHVAQCIRKSLERGEDF
ncbi:hypothetical protein AGABI2DRAFT_199465 [Agaricus bisporus var. bisporus H97]|uniref:hypothetical protein n=1 Tax=Agaricus bisporus var. bisporus (strain H97 / ATCC MYA-4626 / FGSC 10389) TaxID=936046 RepID=UPI00029F705F|nr:hypothetical protein AGABI2DRAFT_199465 [Agaricus bisporus var. bisporus H97]EKV50098.1 hypothetical protein AGABI2DRAFT_199465 [Agaricus bisporus var. bisporus H97]